MLGRVRAAWSPDPSMWARQRQHETPIPARQRQYWALGSDPGARGDTGPDPSVQVQCNSEGQNI